MEETDFFSFCEEDKRECYRLDNLYLQTKSHHHKSKGVNTGSKPLVFLNISLDESTGLIKDIGAFLPEKCYSSLALVKESSYTRRGRDGWVALYIPVNLEHQSQHWNSNCILKAMNFTPVQFRINDNKYLRCKSEFDALNILIQFLAPIKFSVGGVTLVTYSEKDIKYLMKKISDFSLTQIFFNIVSDFLTVLGVSTFPRVPASLQDMVTQYYPSLSRMLNTSVEMSRVMAYIFVQNCQTFLFEGERKEFSVLEEYFTMNYEIKLDEGNEENLTLYVGDLNLKVSENDLIDEICGKTGIKRSEFKIKMCMHKVTGVFLGYCYLTFREHEAALKTLRRMNNEVLYGSHMRVVWHNKHVIGSAKSNANLYIKYLPKNVHQKQLNEIFSVFGKVHSSKVQTDKDGFHTGVGFVQYDKDISAHSAIKLMHGLPIPGQQDLYVSIKQTESQRKGSQHNSGQADRKSGDSSTTSPQLTVNVTEKHSAVDLESIFQKFNNYGNVEFVKTCKDNRKKLVLLVFELCKDADTARKEDGMSFLGARLEVRMFRDNMTEFRDVVLKGERLYVGNIDPLSSDDDLCRMFNSIQKGPNQPVLNSKVMRNSAGDSLQYGYVTVLQEYTDKAVERFHGRSIGGYKLTVQLDQDDPADFGGVFAKSIRQNNENEASTSKASPSIVKSKEVKKIDAKSLMANKLMNAMRKKAKGTPTTSTNKDSEPTKSAPKKAISEYGEDITTNSRQQLPLSAYSHLGPSKQLPVSAYSHLGPTKHDKSQLNKSLDYGDYNIEEESLENRFEAGGFSTHRSADNYHPGQSQTFGRGGGRSSVTTRGGGAYREAGLGEQCDEFGRVPNPSAFGGGFGRGGGAVGGSERGRGHEREAEQERGGVVDQWWPKGGGAGGFGWSQENQRGSVDPGFTSRKRSLSRSRSRSRRKRSRSGSRRRRSSSASRSRSRGRRRRRRSSSSRSRSRSKRRRNRSSSSSSSSSRSRSRRRNKSRRRSSSSPRRRKRRTSSSSSSSDSRGRRGRRASRSRSRPVRRSPSYGIVRVDSSDSS